MVHRNLFLFHRKLFILINLTAQFFSEFRNARKKIGRLKKIGILTKMQYGYHGLVTCNDFKDGKSCVKMTKSRV